MLKPNSQLNQSGEMALHLPYLENCSGESVGKRFVNTCPIDEPRHACQEKTKQNKGL